MWKFTNRNPIDSKIKERVLKAQEQLFQRSDLGFFDEKLLTKAVDGVANLINSEKMSERVIVVGIGGSALGAQAFCQGLEPCTWQNKILFLDNVDAFVMQKKLDTFASPETASWVLISKSGSTIETLSTFDFCRHYLLRKTGTDIVSQTVVVTEEKESPLFAFSERHGRPRLEIPLNIGGRFSVFTPVGLLPLALIGIDLREIQTGWHRAMSQREFVIDLTSEMFNSLLLSEYVFYLFAYSDRLTGFGRWLQQLWSESLAKAKNRLNEPGPLMSNLIPCRGATDQHSVLQQVMEGREKKFVCFIRDHQAETVDWVIESSILQNEIMLGKHIGQLLAAEAQATSDALSEKGIRSLTLKTEGVSASSLAELMMTWMLVVGNLGELLNINAFDQPGVESGKRLARRVLGSVD